MPGHSSIPHGPLSFENLLQSVGLSEREADAVRTIVIGLTAADAAPLMGVGASTVGSYRQRAFQKLGVTTRADFLRIPECALWQEALCQDAAADDEPLGRALEPQFHNDAQRNTEGDDSPVSIRSYPLLFLKCLVISLVVVSSIALLSIFLRPKPAYLDSPNGFISSDYGDIPDVTGMRADAAAFALASAGYYPEFVPRSSLGTPGTTLCVSEIGDMKDATPDRSAIAWEGGSVSGYNLSGDWKAYVLIDVAV